MVPPICLSGRPSTNTCWLLALQPRFTNTPPPAGSQPATASEPLISTSAPLAPCTTVPAEPHAASGKDNDSRYTPGAIVSVSPGRRLLAAWPSVRYGLVALPGPLSLAAGWAGFTKRSAA